MNSLQAAASATDAEEVEPTRFDELETGSAWRSNTLTPGPLRAFGFWVEAYLAAPPGSQRDVLLAPGIRAASAWREEMYQLVANATEEALRCAVPDQIRSALPAQILELLERPFSEQGDFVVSIIEDASHISTATVRTVAFGGDTYQAFVYGRRFSSATKYGIPLHGIIIAERVAIHASVLEPARDPDVAQALAFLGDQLLTFPNQEALLRAESIVRDYEDKRGPIGTRSGYPDALAGRKTAADGATAWTLGEKKVLVLFADFPDLPGRPKSWMESAITPAQFQTVMDTKVAPFYAASSYGKATIKTTVISKLYRCSKNSTAYLSTPFAILDEIKKLAAADLDLSLYDRVIVVFSDLPLTGSGFQIAGSAYIGGRDIVINGNAAPEVIGHELGHTFGLEHANLWETSDDNPIGSAGQSVGYGDAYDLMGGGKIPENDFNGRSKLALNWVTEGAEVKSVTTNQRVRLYSPDRTNQESHEPWLIGARVKKDSANDYWLTYRRTVNSYQKIGNGVCLVVCPQKNGGPTLLIDFAMGANQALPVGEAVTDPEAKVSFKVVGKGGESPNEYVDVDIVFGDFAPLVRLNSPDQTIAAGNSTSFLADIAAGFPRPAVRWQRQVAGSDDWQNLQDNGSVIGAGSEKLVLKQVPASWSGDRFRFQATNTSGSAVSGGAQLRLATSGTFTLFGTTTKSGYLDGDGFGVRLDMPSGLALTPAGSLYVCDSLTVRKATLSGSATQIAPAVGTRYSDELGMPTALTSRSESELFVASAWKVAKLTSTGTISPFAGSSDFGQTIDGLGSSARFNRIGGITYDPLRDLLYCVESAGCVVRQINLSGQVTTLAGAAGQLGYKDGRGKDALFDHPQGLTVGDDGNIYVVDTDNLVIRKVTPEGDVSTFSGMWDGALRPELGLKTRTLRDGSAKTALFVSPTAILFDRQRRCFYVADANRIRRVDIFGNVTTVAGTGDWRDVDGPADQAGLAFSNFHMGMAVTPAGTLFVTTPPTHTVRGILLDPPTLTRAPSFVPLDSFGQAVLTIEATGRGQLRYNWWREGVSLGTTAEPRLSVSGAGSYFVTVSNATGATTTNAITVAAAGESRLTNISTRSLVSSGENIQIAGFIIGGTGAKRVLIRASGPALTPFGVPHVLADPVLSLYTGSTLRAENDDWSPDLAASFVQAGAFAWPSGSRDAALEVELPSGAYTAQVRGKNGDAGVGLVEVYELDKGGARLVNISTRSLAGVGEETLIAGFIVKGTRRVLVRASGPGLRQFGINQTLPDPVLTLFAGQTVIATNDNWDTALDADFKAVNAFSWDKGSKDAAIVLTLTDGAYTAHVTSADAQKGVALVEISQMD